jgi:translation initiation factor 2 subunit 1
MRHVATRTAAPASKAAGEGDEAVEEAAIGGGSEDTRLEALYEQIAWPLAEKYGHTYDAFKLALTYV